MECEAQKMEVLNLNAFVCTLQTRALYIFFFFRMFLGQFDQALVVRKTEEENSIVKPDDRRKESPCFIKIV